MGWVSVNEDIEELRQEHDHFRNGIDNLILRLKESRSFHEIDRVDADLRRLADQLIVRYEENKKLAKAQFEEALKYLRDPSVQIADRLNKRIRERDEARKELQLCKSQLETCRVSQQKSLGRIQDLAKRNDLLVQEVNNLRDAASWQMEIKNTKPR